MTLVKKSFDEEYIIHLDWRKIVYLIKSVIELLSKASAGDGNCDVNREELLAHLISIHIILMEIQEAIRKHPKIYMRNEFKAKMHAYLKAIEIIENHPLLNASDIIYKGPAV